VLTKEQVDALFGNFTFDGDVLKNTSGDGIAQILFEDITGTFKKVFITISDTGETSKAELFLNSWEGSQQAYLAITVGGGVYGINIQDKRITLTGLTIADIDNEPSGNIAVTKEWVQAEIAAAIAAL